MTDIAICLRYLPHPHDAWEAYITKEGERWGGNSITRKDALTAVTLLAQNLAEGLVKATGNSYTETIGNIEITVTGQPRYMLKWEMHDD